MPDLANCCPVCTACALNAASRHVLLCGLNPWPRLRESQSLQQSQVLVCSLVRRLHDPKLNILLNIASTASTRLYQGFDMTSSSDPSKTMSRKRCIM